MDLNRIEAILRLLHGQEHVGDLAVEGEGWKLRARRGMIAPPLAPPPGAEPVVEPAPPARHLVSAGMVGFYRASAPPLRVGDYVDAGKTLGSIDSMGIRTPVTTSESGYLAELKVEDGEPVEYGQELVVLSPEPPDADGAGE